MAARTDQARVKTRWGTSALNDEWEWLPPRRWGYRVGDVLPNGHTVVAVKPNAVRCSYDGVEGLGHGPYKFHQCQFPALTSSDYCKRHGRAL